MSQTFRLTLAQLNPTVGAIEANIALALEAWGQGRAAGAQMVALTEMFVTGYQTQDLILKPAFAVHAERAVADLARQIVDGPALGIGGPLTRDGQLYNAYYILEGGKIAISKADTADDLRKWWKDEEENRESAGVIRGTTEYKELHTAFVTRGKELASKE
jgi:predicted amidohydrolase